MTDDWKEIQERFAREQRDIQRKILTMPGPRHDLKRLVRDGANEKKVLELLFFMLEDRGFWRKTVRRKKKELETVADQLEMVADHAERVSLDPFSSFTQWIAILGLDKWEHVKPPAQCAPTFIFALMRSHAKNCRDQAKAFGNLLREYPPQQKRQMLDCLLLEVWRTTGNYHDAEISRLLTDTFAAAGKTDEQFTEEQIKKHRQRHVVPRIELHQRTNCRSCPSL